MFLNLSSIYLPFYILCCLLINRFISALPGIRAMQSAFQLFPFLGIELYLLLPKAYKNFNFQFLGPIIESVLPSSDSCQCVQGEDAQTAWAKMVTSIKISQMKGLACLKNICISLKLVLSLCKEF